MDDGERGNQKTNDDVSAYEKETLKVERERLNLEQKKLELEESAQAITRRQVRFSLLTTLGSLLVALVSVLVSARSVSQQAEIQAKNAQISAMQQTHQAKDQFELQAANIVVNNDDPQIAYSKALALHELFPERISETWVRQFDPDKYCRPAYEDRVTFLKLATEHPVARRDLAQLWLTMYCEEQNSQFTRWLQGDLPGKK